MNISAYMFDTTRYFADQVQELFTENQLYLKDRIKILENKARTRTNWEPYSQRCRKQKFDRFRKRLKTISELKEKP
eukprot:UN04484